MKRQPEHVFSFVVAELGTEGSIDGNQRLVLRGICPIFTLPANVNPFVLRSDLSEESWQFIKMM